MVTSPLSHLGYKANINSIGSYHSYAVAVFILGNELPRKVINAKIAQIMLKT